MPLAPQITNTPIPYSTWFNSSDYDNSSTAIVTPSATYTLAYPGPSAVNIGDIWFDTSNGNLAYRWDGSNWVSVQDGSIATALTLAGTANTNATNAISTANSAYSLATTASATANGKNKVYYSSGAPGSTANNVGDIWYQYGSYGIVSAQYVGAGGTSWTSVTLTNVTVSSITAGAITAGTITTAVGITNPSGNFTVNGSTGYLTSGANVSGTITATAGSIAGFTIGSSQLSNSQMTIYSNGNITSLGTINAYYISAGISLTSAGTLTVTGNSTLGSTTTTTDLTIDSTVDIIGGYGVTTAWSPNGDNTSGVSCGQSSHRWSVIYSATGTINTSDSRLKTSVQPSSLGLDFINSLNPVSYKWIEGSQEVVKDANGNPVITSTDSNGKPVYQTTVIPGARTHWGFLAQEVKSAIDKTGVEDFAGWTLADKTDPTSIQGLRYEQFIAPLVKAVQELSAEIQTLKGATNGTAAS
jgi:Chaperone of endosialidase